jgi:V8-like Glu-specific endopeptidase
MRIRVLIMIMLAATVARAQSAPARKDIPTIAKAANGAVVSIIMSDDSGHPIAQGSGFVISKDGRILTNYHVIRSGSSAVVKLPDGAFFAVGGVLAFDKTRDIAVIKAHGENFRTVTLGDSDGIQVGEEVVAIGNPLSLESTVSNGIVSGVRTVEEEGGKFLQVTAPISPGSSGGPLFDMAGKVVGITTLYIKGGENLNFAVPINDAKGLILSDSKIQDFPNELEPHSTGADAPPSAGSSPQQNKRFDLRGDVLGESFRELKSPKDTIFVGVKKISDAEFSTIWRGKSTFANRAAQFEMEFREVASSSDPVLDPEKAFLVRVEYQVEFGEAANRDAIFDAIVDDLTEKYGSPQKKLGVAGAIWETADSDGNLSVLAVANLSSDDYITVILSYGDRDI